MEETLQKYVDEAERRALDALDSPAAIQAFLDGIPYSTDHFYRCPLRVWRERVAHCFDGALFGAAALRSLGHRPLILDLFSERDDEHMLALYKRDGHWGAVAKSNFVGLRFREPIYRSLRELVMSYFEVYFNMEREKTLRAYSQPLNLKAFDRQHWMTSDEHLERIAERTDRLRRYSVLTPHMLANLSLVDTRTFHANTMGLNTDGVYKVPGTSAG
jgi:hypothetical protein